MSTQEEVTVVTEMPSARQDSIRKRIVSYTGQQENQVAHVIRGLLVHFEETGQQALADGIRFGLKEAKNVYIHYESQFGNDDNDWYLLVSGVFVPDYPEGHPKR